LSIDILEFYSITLAIHIHDNVCFWSLVGFYGPLYRFKREKAWTNLFALLESLEGLWLCVGDFNTILKSNEKRGGRCGSSSSPNYLGNLMFDLGAMDLGFSRAKFT
jgi:hypothetical protein